MHKRPFFGRLLAVGLAVLLGLALQPEAAEAKRLGGGFSFGKQSSQALKRQAAPRDAATAARPQQSAAAGAAGQRSRFGGMLGGLAAGLGLVWLASALGLGEEFGTVLLVALAAMLLFGLMRAMSAQRQALGGAGGAPGSGRGGPGDRFAFRGFGQAQDLRTGSGQPAAGYGAGQAEPAAGSWRIPAEMDVDAFVATAKSQFVRMQQAFDAGDLQRLREFTSDEVYDELARQVAERGERPNRTEVVTLDAQLLGVESDEREHVASVRFTGLVREAEDATAAPIDEVWNLVKPADGASGWTLAGIQQLG